MEEPTPSALCHRYAFVVLREILSLLLLSIASFLVKPNAFSQARAFQRRLAKLVKPFIVDGNSLNVATLAVALDKS